MTTRRRAESDEGQVAHVPGPSRPKGGPGQCAWKTQGRRCYLTGGMSPYVGENIPLYCHWHYLMLQSPDLCEDYQEFERWAAGWQHYCAEENHWPPPDVWEAVLGNQDLPLYKRHPCLVESPSGPALGGGQPSRRSEPAKDARKAEREEAATALTEEQARLTPFQQETRNRLLGLDGQAISDEVPF